jgi:uncharacterized membrane protein YqjE
MIFFIFPLTLILLLSLGLNIQFQSNNHQIRYNNDNLTQLVLSLVTVASGAYTLKKTRGKTIIERNKRETL